MVRNQTVTTYELLESPHGDGWIAQVWRGEKCLKSFKSLSTVAAVQAARDWASTQGL